MLVYKLQFFTFIIINAAWQNCGGHVCPILPRGGKGKEEIANILDSYIYDLERQQTIVAVGRNAQEVSFSRTVCDRYCLVRLIGVVVYMLAASRGVHRSVVSSSWVVR